MDTKVLNLKPASPLQSFTKLLSEDTTPRIAFVVAAIEFSSPSPRFGGFSADESLKSTLPFDPLRIGIGSSLTWDAIESLCCLQERATYNTYNHVHMLSRKTPLRG